MKTIILPLVFFCVSLLSVSCINDEPNRDFSACEHYVDVRALDGDNSQISDVSIYVYDAGSKLIGYHRTEVVTLINIDGYRAYGFIKIIAWGNALSGAAQTLSDPVLGSSMSDHKLVQNPSGSSFAGTALTHDPSDLFFGTIDINFANLSSGKNNISTVYVSRAVSSYVLTIRHVGQFLGGPTDDYTVVVRHPYSSLDFAGKPIGTQSAYMSNVSYDASRDELTTPISMALPTGSEVIVIEVYSGGKLAYTTTVDSSGNMISMEPNKLYNIMIDIERDAIDLVVSGWGEVVIFEGFD